MFLDSFIYKYETMKIVNIFIINPKKGLRPAKNDITNKKKLSATKTVPLYNGYKERSNFKNAITLNANISPILIFSGPNRILYKISIHTVNIALLELISIDFLSKKQASFKKLFSGNKL